MFHVGLDLSRKRVDVCLISSTRSQRMTRRRRTSASPCRRPGRSFTRRDSRTSTCTRRPRSTSRTQIARPLLLVGATEDHTVPASLAKAAYKRYEQSPTRTDYLEFEGRPHFHMVPPDWQEVAASTSRDATAPLNGPEPIARMPASGWPARRVSAIAPSISASAGRARSTNSVPPAVSPTRRVVRTNRTAPRSRSRSRIARDSGDCDMCKRSAARPKCNSSAPQRNTATAATRSHRPPRGY